MASIFLTAALMGLILLLFSRARASKIRRDGGKLATPPNTLPLLGNSLLFLQPRHKLLQWFAEREQQYGFETYEISVPTLPPGIVINDPKNLEFVLQQDDIFTKGDFFRKRSWDLFGYGIINSDGQLWKTQRKAGSRFFSTPNLKILLNDKLPLFLSDSINLLKEHAHSGKAIDLEALFTDLTTRVMGCIAYDMDIRGSESFCTSFDFASGAIGERFQNPLWRLTELFTGRRLRLAISAVKKFGHAIVSNAVQRRKKAPGSSDALFGGKPNDRNLMDHLIDGIADPLVIADASLNFLSAGRDTTAQHLTWTFYLLTRYPSAAARIRAELATIPHSESLASHILNSPLPLPYSLAMLHESLRLYPPVPVELKQASYATKLPDGTCLPARSVVLWSPWAMGRSERIWGADASEFRPERWLIEGADGSTKLLSRPAHEHPVFHGGARSCLGKRMAEMQGLYVLAQLVADFEFVAAEEGERRSRNSLTLPMEGGLPCFVGWHWIWPNTKLLALYWGQYASAEFEKPQHRGSYSEWAQQTTVAKGLVKKCPPPNGPSPNGPTLNTPTNPTYTPTYVARIIVRLNDIEGEAESLTRLSCLARNAQVADPDDPDEPCGVFGITELPPSIPLSATQQDMPARTPIEIRNVRPGAKANAYCGVNRMNTFVCSYPRGDEKGYKLTLEGGQMALEPTAREGVNRLVAAGVAYWKIDISNTVTITLNQGGRLPRYD
ncbi:MAG: hypothetical protein M1829_000919 [Trizodia sp. TS-e1964]|nr:MAG: hypothetical protein M1829_000919 [Trizodia sp. TS-e1964]